MKIVDARGLQHPEPFERVVDALSELAPGDQLKLIIHLEPRPLYRFLERNHYAYQALSFPDGRFEIVIWELPA
jgi:uncharacterized protein (DUF2249 family)